MRRENHAGHQIHPGKSRSRKENIKKKFQDSKLPLVDEVIELDAKRRAAIAEADQLRSNRNTLSKQVGMLMGQAKKDPSKLAGGRGRQGPGEAAGRPPGGAGAAGDGAGPEDPPGSCSRSPRSSTPPCPSAPTTLTTWRCSASASPWSPTFPIPYHTEIMESFDGIDMDAAGRVSGNGFYYLLGDIARLHEAVLAYARDFMIDKGFTYCIPPS